MEPQEILRGPVRLVGESIGAGRAILLLHAGGERRQVWRPVAAFLAERGFRAVSYDQRGHGESGGSPSDGLPAYGADASAMIAGLDRPLVVGASLGGFALIAALESMSARVSGLVLVDVTPAPDPERARAYLAPRAGLGASPLVDDILSRSTYLSDVARGLTLPMMLVCAGAKSPLGAAGRAEFRKLCPKAEIRTIEHASHLVARDAPIELATIISEFAIHAGGGGAKTDQRSI